MGSHRTNQWALVLLVIGLSGVSCTQQRGEAGEGRALADTARPVAVEAVGVSMREVRRTVETVGSFSPAEDAMVSSEVAGQVIDVHVGMGDRVEEGEVMVEVSPMEHELAVAQQQAALDQVRARLGLSEGETTLADIREAATVKRAAADLADAEQKFKRAQELLEEGLLPRQGYEDAEARLKSSQANYDLSLQEVRNLLATLKQYMLTGEVMDAATAARIGLVHEAVDDAALPAAVTRLTDALLAGGPCAQAEAKALLRRITGQSDATDSKMQRELAHWIARLRGSDEGREGLSAFLEKRPANWRNPR